MTFKQPLYPDIHVTLSGMDRNAINIIAALRRELKRNHVSGVRLHAFTMEVREGDYDHVLATCMKWVDVS